MKIASLIILCLFLASAMQPVFINISLPGKIIASHKMKGCCAKPNQNKKCNRDNSKGDRQQPCKSNNGCNPFLPCTTCLFMTSDQQNIIHAIGITVSPKIGMLSQFICQGYNFKCWHPPK